jgi:ribonuclease P protein component
MSVNIEKSTFTKSERLCSKKIIEDIFANGKKLKAFPFVANFLIIDSKDCDWDNQVKIVISVPKKKVRFANKRNRVKRQIKEAYRLNKSTFYSELNNKNKHLALFLIYLGKEKEDYQYLEQKLKTTLNKILDTI